MALLVPGYDLRDVMATTKSGSIWRGSRVRDGQPVVVVSRVLSGTDARPVQQLRHGYHFLQRISGVAIARVCDLVEIPGGLALAYEDCGGTCLDLQVTGPANVDRFLPLAIGMATAVAEVHEQQCVHKDIKPANFMYNAATGMLKITDFGIAAHLPYGSQSIDPNGAVEGTLAYMAPEQSGRMNRGLDARADLYALGVSFYEMLTGRLPFTADDALGWVHCHLARQPRSPHELAPETPTPLVNLILKLLAKSPEERYQTAKGLLYDLTLARQQDWSRLQVLGAKDVSGHFNLNHNLYGRSEEKQQLRTWFAAAATAPAPTVVTVAGHSGIGKSSLVNELQPAIVLAHGFFAAGKFDQFKKGIPLATLVEALAGLVPTILGASADSFAQWRLRLRTALGNNGRLITDLIPELSLIIDAQPPVPQLDPAEAQNRFNLTFVAFLQALAAPDHPLVLFLDDMQWADSGTLALLELVVARPDIGSLLLVLAYRDNEVGAAHPLRLALDRLHEPQGSKAIVLGPLATDAVEHIVADTLGCAPGVSRPLAALVEAKTNGNPFFAIEFLKTLYRSGAVQFDRVGAAWTWDQTKINATSAAGNVVSLVSDRLAALPAECREALRLGATIGHTFLLTDLAAMLGRDSVTVSEYLRLPVEEDLVMLSQGSYGPSATVRFRHDRIHQAAYELVTHAERPALHRQIADLLLARRTSSDDGDIFAIVNHLNAAASLLTSASDRALLCELNREAGHKAKNATAYGSALTYFGLAVVALAEDAWETSYQATFALMLGLAESQFLAGHLDLATATFKLAFDRSCNAVDRARVAYLQLKLYQVAGKYLEAADLALASFRAFGLDLPTDDAGATAVFLAEIALAKTATTGRSVATLIDLPALENPELIALMGLLEASAPPMYMARPALFPVITMKMVNISLASGNTETSTYGYGVYGLLLAAVFNEVERGYAFIEMAMALNERLNDPKLRGSLLHLYGDHINFWHRPMATSAPALERGFVACLEAGDLIYSNYIAFQGTWQAYERGDTLASMALTAEKYAAFALQSKHAANYQTILLERQFAKALMGQTTRPASMSDPQFAESTALQVIDAAVYACGQVYYHIMRQILCFYDRRWDEALAASVEAAKTLSAALSMPIQPTYYFFRGMTLAAAFPTLDLATQPAALAEIQQISAQFATWAGNCPENFAARRSLLAGEVARLSGSSTATVQEHYAEAARWAASSGCTPVEALAREMTARLHFATGDAPLGCKALNAALLSYRAWGCTTKQAALLAEFPAIAELPPSTSDYAQMDVPNLDVLAVLKASQTISSEIDYAKLLQKLMEVLLEIAGAATGGLVLFSPDGDRLEVLLSQEQDRAGRTHDLPLDLAAATTVLPVTIVNYVKRTGKSVMLEDARTVANIQSDPYIQAR